MRNAALSPIGPSDGVNAAGRGWLLRGLGIVGILSSGLGLGLLATAWVIDRGWDPGAVAIGPWVTSPKVGTTAIDPYALARLARTGEVPLAANEGLAFTARTDDTGYQLLRSCTYRLSGPVPAARYWTLTAVDVAGRPMENPARRAGFTSTTVIRDLSGGFTVESGPQARPGNWLPTPGAGPMSLLLRLYDTPLTANANAVPGASMPGVTRLACAAPDATATP